MALMDSPDSLRVDADAHHALHAELVGADAGLRDVVEAIDRVAPLDVPVLLLGETGSGKEVISRQIHERSRRRGGPLVRVNCGAIPAELIDSELFGHEKGSFTGAVNSREGWFERAHGGTLLLDEVGDLPLAAQVRLLRVLQDGEVSRVGAARSRTVDVRVVAATHRDLEKMVAEGTFRQDLWFRLSVFPILVPPLRARPGDIADLARHFAARSARRLGGPPIEPTPADLEALRAYDWPGNVRELAAVMERAVILGDGRRLDVERAIGRVTPRRPDGSAVAPPSAPVDLSLDAAITAHIRRVLVLAEWKIEGASGAAALLGLRPSTLRSRMKRLGIGRERPGASDPPPTSAR